MPASRVGTWLSDDFAQFTPAPLRSHVRCPVPAIHGEDDERGTPGHVRLIAGAGTLHLLPAPGHLPYRQRPGEVIAPAADFLRDLPRDRGAAGPASH